MSTVLVALGQVEHVAVQCQAPLLSQIKVLVKQMSVALYHNHRDEAVGITREVIHLLS